jgi:hypothetical protein
MCSGDAYLPSSHLSDERVAFEVARKLHSLTEPSVVYGNDTM